MRYFNCDRMGAFNRNSSKGNRGVKLRSAVGVGAGLDRLVTALVDSAISIKRVHCGFLILLLRRKVVPGKIRGNEWRGCCETISTRD